MFGQVRKSRYELGESTNFAQLSSLPNDWETEEVENVIEEASITIDDDVSEMVGELAAELQLHFGFQRDSIENVKQLFLSMLDSRLGRCQSVEQCALIVHSELVGLKSSYKMWCKYHDIEDSFSADTVQRQAQGCLLYLMIWAEAANLRFIPELLCFIFHCALNDLCASVTRDEGHFLDNVVVPLYDFLWSQNYEKSVDGTLLYRGLPHTKVFGIDDINEFFQSKTLLHTLKCTDGNFFDKPVQDRYSQLLQVEWCHVFKKTFYETRTFMHVFVNYAPILQVHTAGFLLMAVGMFVSLYEDESSLQKMALTLSTTAVCPLISIMIILAEASFFPRHSSALNGWSNGLLRAIGLFAVNVIPPILVFLPFIPANALYAIIAFQVVISIGTVAVCDIWPFLRKVQRNPWKQPQAQRNEWSSILFWMNIFILKFTFSWFYLIQPLRDPIKSILYSQECEIDNPEICQFYLYLQVTMILVLNFILYFLDTYIMFTLGMSIYSAWLAVKNGFVGWSDVSTIFEKIRIKLLNCYDLYNLARMWNSFIISMYKDLIISGDECMDMLFQKDSDGQIKTPTSLSSTSNPAGQQRLSAFVQSMSGECLPALQISQMPTMSVIIPHYNEKVLLLLKEIIYDHYEHQRNKLCLIDYLKILYPQEWTNYVDAVIKSQPHQMTESELYSLNKIGICRFSEENVFRLRCFASLHCQTLVRTVTGFLNCRNALKVLSSHETAEKKFNIVVAVQRYSEMSSFERQNIDYLLQQGISISYIDCIPGENNQPVYYSCLKTQRGVKYRIRLPGYPLLSDGKADNQSLSLPFCRGEILQLIDSNQDCHIENGFKLPNVLHKFVANSELAILGAREEIFTANIGSLANVSALKELTFGSMSQRFSTDQSVRLHYGHPDFVRFQFALCNGGISKAQKKLNLNEDIYFGINAVLRGQRVGFTEFYQCSKGRDLGLLSIFQFSLKIGTGNSEQIISRDWYNLCVGMRLPRLLSLYYTSIGFHINNMLSILAISLFVLNLYMVQIRSIFCNSDICESTAPVIDYIASAVVAIAITSIICYVPLFAQLAIDQGIYSAAKKIFMQVVSLSPVFEVFVTKVYEYSLMTAGLLLSSSQYRSTGRGFAIYRQHMIALYDQFSDITLLSGGRILLLLSLSAFSGVVKLHLLFFAAIALALFMSPFLFNPHAYDVQEVLLDYGMAMNYLFCIDGAKAMGLSWYKHIIGYAQDFNGRVYDGMTGKLVQTPPTLISVLLWSIARSLFPAFLTGVSYIYAKTLQDSQNGVMVHVIALVGISMVPLLLNLIFMLIIITLATFVGPCIKRETAGTMGGIMYSIGKLVSMLVGILYLLVVFEYEAWQFKNFLVFIVASCYLQKWALLLLIKIFVGALPTNMEISKCFYNGQWHHYRSEMSLWATLKSACTFLIINSVGNVYFLADFIFIHAITVLLFLPSLLPYADRVHTKLLFWNFETSLSDPSASTKLSEKIDPISVSRKKQRMRKIFLIVLIAVVMFCVALFVVPSVLSLPSPFNESTLASLLPL
ncbi:hypothetical protein MIR68_006866 [Amoeboaphelidium protococcarum]|nr:hypothetical protein MIR68_006866 [Amoeboaphelidium protococcarum]